MNRGRTLHFLILIGILICSAFFYESAPNDVSRSSDENARIEKVIDGDSFIIRRQGASTTEPIRLYGVDAPEHAQAYGREAKNVLTELTKGIKLKISAIEKDAYGRTIALVVLEDGTLLQHSLLERGAVWNYQRYSKRQDFISRERDARKKHRGLWKEKSPLPPWVFRKQQRRENR